jgi:pyruvate,water dikinase
MIESDASGVMFSIDPVNNDKSIIVIEAIYGLGEYIVQGTVTPDHYEVDKKTLHILKKSIATQEHKMALKGKNNVDMILKKDARNTQKISDRHIIELANLARKLEKHYYFPQDIEWALENNEVFIVQTRPITTIKKQSAPQTLADSSNRKVILTGDPASPGIASGAVRLLHSAKDIDKIHQGEVLVAPQTNPDYVPAMKKACAIVTEHGGRTSHAAIVSRELGIPAVVGTPNAMSALKNGQVITVEGATGKIYDGGLSEADKASIARAAKPVKDYKTATKVYVNLAEPSRVEEVAKRHVDGGVVLRGI